MCDLALVVKLGGSVIGLAASKTSSLFKAAISHRQRRCTSTSDLADDDARDYDFCGSKDPAAATAVLVDMSRQCCRSRRKNGLCNSKSSYSVNDYDDPTSLCTLSLDRKHPGPLNVGSYDNLYLTSRKRIKSEALIHKISSTMAERRRSFSKTQPGVSGKEDGRHRNHGWFIQIQFAQTGQEDRQTAGG